MKIETSKKTFIGFIVIVAFLYTAFTVSNILFNVSPEQNCSLETGCPHEKQLTFLVSIIPLIVSIAVIIGAGTYYVMAGKLESSKKNAKKTAELVLKFLNPNEKQIVEMLIKNKGKLYQSEVSRSEGMTKLKAHRIIQKLADRQVIEIQKNGKTNILRFNPEIEESILG